MAIFTYHSLDPEWESPLAVAPERFAEHVRWFRRTSEIVGAERIAGEVARHGRLPKGLSALTFDDGFRDLFEHALPCLSRHRVPATVFLVARAMSENAHMVDWIDDPTAHSLTTLSVDQVLEMRDAGISFGSHSRDHQDLTQLDDDECLRDLSDSREMLEDVLSRPVTLLAYPRGLHDQRVRAAAERAGFQYAFGTSRPCGPPGPFAVPRVGVYRRNRPLTLKAKTTRAYAAFRRLRG